MIFSERGVSPLKPTILPYRKAIKFFNQNVCKKNCYFCIKIPLKKQYNLQFKTYFGHIKTIPQ